MTLAIIAAVYVTLHLAARRRNHKLTSVRGATKNANVPNQPIRYVGEDDVLITPQGVEIPVAWLANGDDLDEVIACLAEIDRLGAYA